MAVVPIILIAIWEILKHHRTVINTPGHLLATPRIWQIMIKYITSTHYQTNTQITTVSKKLTVTHHQYRVEPDKAKTGRGKLTISKTSMHRTTWTMHPIKRIHLRVQHPEMLIKSL